MNRTSENLNLVEATAAKGGIFLLLPPILYKNALSRGIFPSHDQIFGVYC